MTTDQLEKHHIEIGLSVATRLEIISAHARKLEGLLKEGRDDIEGRDHGEDAPGMGAWQRQFVREVDDILFSA